MVTAMRLVENSSKILFDSSDQEFMKVYSVDVDGVEYLLDMKKTKPFSKINVALPSVSMVEVAKFIDAREITFSIPKGKVGYVSRLSGNSLSFIYEGRDKLIFIISYGEKQPGRYVCVLDGIVKV